MISLQESNEIKIKRCVWREEDKNAENALETQGNVLDSIHEHFGEFSLKNYLRNQNLERSRLSASIVRIKF